MKAKENLAPRGNAEGRVISKVSAKQNKASGPEWEADFAAAFIARRYRLAAPLARAVATLAGLGRAFA